MKKYKLTDETVTADDGTVLFRIEALVDIECHSVKIGDKGGFIEKEYNLSHEGYAWVYDNARVYDNAQVYGNAWVSGDAQVSGDAWVSDCAWVSDGAWVSGDARVYDNAQVSGNA